MRTRRWVWTYGLALMGAVSFCSTASAGFTLNGGAFGNPYLTFGTDTTKYYYDAAGVPVFNSAPSTEREELQAKLNTMTAYSSLDLTDNRYRTTEEAGFTDNDFWTSSVITGSTNPDAENMSISWDGGTNMLYEDLWLYVRDGRGNEHQGYRPWYAFDLRAADWDGESTVHLHGFYAIYNGAAISHASFFSGGDHSDGFSSVPEPASVAIWLTAAVGGCFARRRRQKNRNRLR